MQDSRMGHFASGAMSGGPGETASLQARAAEFNSKNPRAFRANGLNQPYMLSPNNANSARDAARQTPAGQLPSMNGMSMSTYEQINPTQYGMALNI